MEVITRKCSVTEVIVRFDAEDIKYLDDALMMYQTNLSPSWTKYKDAINFATKLREKLR